MKPLVVIAKDNAASQNIKAALLGIGGFEEREQGFWSCDDFCMAEYAGSIVEIVPSHDAEYYIFASTHKSSSNTPSFSAHTPGNWGKAQLGGKPRTLNFAYASKVKECARKMKELSDAKLGWQVSVEVDHHGPSLERPVLFAEIGSTQEQWENEKAGEIVAKSIIAAITSTVEFDCYVGFGGSHYAPKFTPIVIGGNIALGHIISGYALERDGVQKETVLQAMQKNVEKPKGALIDWKGIKGRTREQLIQALDELEISWEKAKSAHKNEKA